MPKTPKFEEEVIIGAKKEPKVVIGVPVSDTDAMRALTAQAIAGSIITAGGKVIDMVLRRSCDIASNRTFLVNAAINAGATHILFVDSDMIFPHDIIDRLLSHKKEIVGVRYKKREFPVKWLYEAQGEESETELFKANHVGTGLLLIDLSVFKNLKGSWFNFGRDSQGALVLGEDIWFCGTARDAGYDVWVDPAPVIGHIGEYIF